MDQQPYGVASKNVCLRTDTWMKLADLRKRHEKEIRPYQGRDRAGSDSGVIAWLIWHQTSSDQKADGKIRKRQAGNNPPPPFVV